MGSIYDQKTKKQIEEFHQRLQGMSELHRKAVIWTSADRLMRDFDSMRQPPRLRPWIYELGRFMMRVAKRVKRLCDGNGNCIERTFGAAGSEESYDETDFGG